MAWPRRVPRGRMVASAWWIRPPPSRSPPNPDRNILLVTIDTLRADALGSYGGRAATPNLDRLAADGARFTFAHAHAVVTLPSHASILSGRYPYEHGIRDNTGYRFPASAADRGHACSRRQASRPARSSAASRSIGDSAWAPASTSTTTSFGRGTSASEPGERERPRRRRRDVGAGVDRTTARQVVRVGPRLRSARALRAAGPLGGALPVGSVPRRSVVDRRRARRAVRSAGHAVSRPRWSSSPPITARASAITAS